MGDEGDTIRVVHVDDETDFARLTARHLGRESDRFSIDTATTAADALELVTAETDCVVSDYQMTDTDGLALFETVRDRYPELPFILFTDTGSEAVASEAISAGVTDYLIKGVVAEQHTLLATKIITSVERRRAEERAARTERQLTELAEQTDDVLWMFSADWDSLQFVNGAYETVFDRSVSELVDEPDAFLAAVHPDDRDRVMLAMERAAGGESVRIEYRIETPSGGDRWVTSHAEPIVEGGEVARIAGYTRDVTDRKRWEQTIEAKNAQLERFASLVAHDLRNPWNVADGYLDLAREHGDSDDLQRVAAALDRMDQIITDLLALARAGATIDEREPIDVADLAGSSWELVAQSDATVRIETDLTVVGDATRVAQVFENLFRNAVEHGGSTVTITVGTLADGSGFYVEDDGPGIPESEREAVLEHGHTTAEGGTGFGLAIVSEIVAAHGWTLRLDESDSGGARFEIRGIESTAE